MHVAFGGVHKVRMQVSREGALTKSIHLFFYCRHSFKMQTRGTGSQIFDLFERRYFADALFHSD